VTLDYAEAVKWFRLAAEHGHSGAQCHLGEMYAEGHGVEQDYVQAHMWFNLAAAAGETGGSRGRSTVAERMTPLEIAEAQRLARTWKPIGRAKE
jgi:TPR repeat protein